MAATTTPPTNTTRILFDFGKHWDILEKRLKYHYRRIELEELRVLPNIDDFFEDIKLDLAAFNLNDPKHIDQRPIYIATYLYVMEFVLGYLPEEDRIQLFKEVFGT